MQRQGNSLVPVGDALSGMGGSPSPAPPGRRELRRREAILVCSAWLYSPMPLSQDRDTTGVYSRSVLSGTGTTGSVVKMRVPGSISRATAVNRSPPGALQRTDPAKSDVSVSGNAWSMSQAGIVKLRLTAVFDAQHGGFETGWSPISWGSIAELFVNLTMPFEGSWMTPGSDCLRVEPQCQLPTFHQSPVVLRPVANLISEGVVAFAHPLAYQGGERWGWSQISATTPSRCAPADDVFSWTALDLHTMYVTYIKLVIRSHNHFEMGGPAAVCSKATLASEDLEDYRLGALLHQTLTCWK